MRKVLLNWFRPNDLLLVPYCVTLLITLIPGCTLLGLQFTMSSQCQTPGICGNTGRLLYSTGETAIVEVSADSMLHPFTHPLTTLAGFSFGDTSDGLRLYAVGSDLGGQQVIEFDGRDYGTIYRRVTIHECSALDDIAVLQDGNLVVSCASNLQLYKILTSSFTLDEGFSCCPPDLTSFFPGSLAVAFDGSILSGKLSIHRIDQDSGDVLGVVVPAAESGARSFQDLVIGPNGNLFVSNNLEVEVQEYDGETFQFVRTVVHGRSNGYFYLGAIAFGISDELFVFVQTADEAFIGQFDPETGALVQDVVRGNASTLSIVSMQVRP